MRKISLTHRVLDNQHDPRDFVRRGKPRWLRAKMPHNDNYQRLRSLVRERGLHTVCEEARCPNMGECWSNGVGTLMILGDTCTRSCGFCDVATGRPPTLDLDEPRRVGEAVALMDLQFVCITSVNRDELPDGGAGVWADTIREVRRQAPDTRLEVLIPDFCGDWNALQTVLDAGPDVLNHNLETVPRLYKAVRPQAKYERSLELLRRSKEQGFITKTGIMAGIGETDDEIVNLMHDLIEYTAAEPKLETRNSKLETSDSPSQISNLKSQIPAPPYPAPCDILTIGQYLQPSPRHLPVSRFVHPDRFDEYKRIGESLGLTHVESGPMVRSSYHADQQAQRAEHASACPS